MFPGRQPPEEALGWFAPGFVNAAADSIDAASRPDGRFGDTPLVEAAIRRTLRETCRLLGHFDAAEPQLVRALEIRESLPGDETDLVVALFDLGSLYEEQGYFDRAGALLARALAISTRAEMEEIFGHHDRAEALHREVVEARTRVLGPEHPMTLLSMVQLAAAAEGALRGALE